MTTSETSPPIECPATYPQRDDVLATCDGVDYANVLVTMRARGPFAIDVGQAAWAGMCERHEAFRLSLELRDADVIQVVTHRAFEPMEFADLARRPVTRARTQALRCYLRQFTRKPFRLDAAPLARAAVIQLGREDHILAWVVAHVIWDLESWRLFLREYVALYDIYARRPVPRHVRPAVGTGGLAIAERTGARLEDVAYWQSALVGTTGRLEIGIDRGLASTLYEDASVPLTASSAGLGQALTTVARTMGGTQAIAVFAALACALYSLSGQTDFLVSVWHRFRNRPGARQLIGGLVDVLPVRVDLNGNPTFRGAVATAIAYSRAAKEHRVAGAHIAHLLAEPCDVAFNFCDMRGGVRYGPVGEASGVRFEAVALGALGHLFPAKRMWWGAQVDVSVHIAPGGVLTGELAYNAAALEPVAAQSIASLFEQILRLASRFPDMAVDRLASIAARQAGQSLSVLRGGSA